MKNNIEFSIVLKDKMTAVSEKISNVARKMGDDLKQAFDKIKDKRGIGEVVKSVEKATSALNKLGNTAKSVAQRFNDDFKKLTSGGGGLAQFAGYLLSFGAIAGITGSIIEFSKSAIQASESMKQQALAMSVMLKSADKAKKLMNDLEMFALKTPFNTDGLLQATRMLTAFGFSAENVLPMMRAIGNAVGMMGGGQAQMDGIVLALGQIQAKGKLAGQELMQLTNQNIAARKYLQEHFQKSSAEIEQMMSKGAVSAKDAITAIVNGMQRDFEGGMDKMSETIPGYLSNISEAWDTIKREVGGAISDAIGLKDILKEISEVAERFITVIKTRGLKDAWFDLVPPWLGATIFAIGGAITGILVVSLGLLASALLGALGVAASTVGIWVAVFAAIGVAIYGLISTWDLMVDAFHLGFEALTDLFSVHTSNIISIVARWAMTIVDFCRPILNLFSSDIPDAINKWGNAQVQKSKELNQMWANKKGGYVNRATALGTKAKERFSGLVDIEVPEVLIGGYNGLLNGGGSVSAGDGGGSVSSGGGRGGGGSAVDKVKQTLSKIESATKDFAKKIGNNIHGAYMKGIRDLNDEIQKTEQLISEGTANGVDTSKLQQKLAEYTKLMKDKLLKEWKHTWAEMSLSVDEIKAKLTDNSGLLAQVAYQKELLKIEKERERIYKEAFKGDNQEEAKRLSDTYATLAKEQAERQRIKSERQGELDELSNYKKILTAKFEMNAITLEQMAEEKRKYLAEEIRLNSEILNSDKSTLAERAEAIGRLKDNYKEMLQVSADVKETVRNALTESYNSLGTVASRIGQAVNDISSNITSKLGDGLFEAMSGNFRKISDAFGDMARDILKMIAKFLAQTIVQKFLGSILGGRMGGFGGIFGGFFGGGRATGGAVEQGVPYLVGERHPEIFVPNTAGKIYNRLPSGTNSAPIVNINIQNNTNAEFKAESRTRFDGKQYIVDTVLTAITTNQGGMKDLIKGVR